MSKEYPESAMLPRLWLGMVKDLVDGSKPPGTAPYVWDMLQESLSFVSLKHGIQ